MAKEFGLCEEEKSFLTLIEFKELVVEIIWYLRFILGIEQLVLGLRNQHGD